MHDGTRGTVAGQATRLALVVATLAAVMMLVPFRRLGAQISPGPLSRAHASLDGSLGCASCHAGGRANLSQRCVSCHKEIAWAREQQRGFHARGDAATAECASCHPEHAGRDFDLIRWPSGSASRFDHASAGWTLEGKHTGTACASCHKPDFRVSPAATLSPRQGGPRWLGLEQRCASCHEDPHRTRLGDRCTKCHDLTAWKPAPKYDHDSSSYPLTGAHRDVSCASCHLAPRLNPATAPDGHLIAVFKPVPFGDCASCHTDPHQGRLTGKCSACHTTTGFQAVARGSFAHDRTRFPLLGKHATVACAQCHTGYPKVITRPAFATCATCHADPHAGRATLAGRATDCASCHSERGFAPSTFTVAQHQGTPFPLLGKHATVTCASCHRTHDVGGVHVVADLRPAHDRCVSCHENAHGAQLAARADSGSCESCHSAAGWKPSTFSVAAHGALRVTLAGRHGDVPCASCHGPDRPGLAPLGDTALGTARVALRPPEVTCVGCHRNPHPRAMIARTPACETCHDQRGFHPTVIDVVAHGRYRFPLDGAHRAVPCSDCHRELTRTSALHGPATLVLAGSPADTVLAFPAPRTCAGCHTTPHGTQFLTRSDRGACESCHVTDSFTPATRFNHDRDARFHLSPSHNRVACASCHVRQSAAATSPVIYRGTQMRCAECHSGGTR